MSEKKAEKTPQELYAAARGALLLVVVCTALNVVLQMVHVDWQFSFMSALADTIARAAEGVLFDVLGLLVAMWFLLMWMLAGKQRWAMTCALVFYGIDCIFAVPMLIGGGFVSTTILHFALRLLVGWALWQGVRAAGEMKKQEEAVMVLLNGKEDEKIGNADPVKEQE